MSRGYVAIQEALKRAAILAEWQKQFRPEIKSLRLKRADYDVIARYPKAGEMQSPEPVKYREDGIYFMGFMLIYDQSEARYGKKPAPEQAVIE